MSAAANFGTGQTAASCTVIRRAMRGASHHHIREEPAGEHGCTPTHNPTSSLSAFERQEHRARGVDSRVEHTRRTTGDGATDAPERAIGATGRRPGTNGASTLLRSGSKAVYVEEQRDRETRIFLAPKPASYSRRARARLPSNTLFSFGRFSIVSSVGRSPTVYTDQQYTAQQYTDQPVLEKEVG